MTPFQYINKIRNPGKKAYAEEVWNFLLHGGPDPDYHRHNISLMAAQAVEMQLREIARAVL